MNTEAHKEVDQLTSPHDTKLHPSAQHENNASQWQRFFARLFDIWWQTLLISILFGAALGSYYAQFVDWLYQPGRGIAFALLCLPLALLLDALIYRLAGNTPGKAMLGLKVTLQDGSPLGFMQYLARNFGVWARGLGFGVPVITLVTMGLQSARLTRGEPAGYDVAGGYRVTAAPIGLVRESLFSVAFACLLALMAIMSSLDQSMREQFARKPAPSEVVWFNPVTGKHATVGADWDTATLTAPDGSKVYGFNHWTGRAAVFLAVEKIPDVTLDDYTRSFRLANTGTMRFRGEGDFEEAGGKRIWLGHGEALQGPSNRMQVRVVQGRHGFWRLVAIQMLPDAYTDPQVIRLQDVLWNSIH
jgi:uncharacterized RDD family membrane protein YckC